MGECNSCTQMPREQDKLNILYYTNVQITFKTIFDNQEILEGQLARFQWIISPFIYFTYISSFCMQQGSNMCTASGPTHHTLWGLTTKLVSSGTIYNVSSNNLSECRMNNACSKFSWKVQARHVEHNMLLLYDALGKL